jgi:hypothetical protein
VQTEAQLSIKRASQWTGRIRQLQVYVDRRRVGSLAPGEQRRFPVDPGRHTVGVRMDWTRSGLLPITVGEGETVSLECGSPVRGWRLLLALYYLLFPSRWWYIRRVEA